MTSMSLGRIRAAGFAAAVVLLACAAGVSAASAGNADPAPIILAQATPDPAAAEKEAFDATKELGTVEAWQAFVNNFPTGFRSDLARAYIANLSKGGQGTAAAPTGTPPPTQTGLPAGQGTSGLGAAPSTLSTTAPLITIPPLDSTPPGAPGAPVQPPMATRLGLLDLGPGIVPWQNGTIDVDDGSRKAYAAQVAGNGMELIATCVPPKSKKDSYALALMLRENPRGIYPEFDTRLQEGMDGAPASGADFRQITLSFDGSSVFEGTGRIFEMTGELEITADGKPVPANGRIVDAMMGGRTMTVLADPFSGTFQLTKSRPALCSVLLACGAKISACKGVSAPKVSSKPVKPTTQTKVFVPQTAKGTVSPPPGFVPSQQGYVPPQQPQPFVPLSAAKSGGTQPQGGATLVIQQTATGPCSGAREVRNSTGQCVCDASSARFNGKCVVACIGNATGYDASGKCTCPAGQVWDGACFTPTKEGVAALKDFKFATCPDGRLKDANGNCIGGCASADGKLGGGFWNGQKCIGYDQTKDAYCGDLGLADDSDFAKEGRCKKGTPGGLTVKLVPQGGTGKTGGTTGIVLPQGAAPVLQLFQGGGGGGGSSAPCPDPKTQVRGNDGQCACKPSLGKVLFTPQGCLTEAQAKNYYCRDIGLAETAAAKGSCKAAPGGGLVVPQGGAPVIQLFQGLGVLGGGGQVQQQQTVTCTGGQVPQTNGTCACPSGQQLTAGKCVVVKVIKQQTIVITCTGGQVPQINGTCACPSGQQFSSGKCVAAGGQTVQPQGVPPTLPGGFNLLLSDRRAKTDVVEIAMLPNGIRLYAFRYRGDATMRVGVMAQDLLADERTRAAVHSVGGVYGVDYTALGLRMAPLAEWRERGVEAVRLH